MTMNKIFQEYTNYKYYFNSIFKKYACFLHDPIFPKPYNRYFLKWHIVFKWSSRYLMRISYFKNCTHGGWHRLKMAEEFSKTIANILLWGRRTHKVSDFIPEKWCSLRWRQVENPLPPHLNFPTLNLRQNFPILSRCSSGSFHCCPQTLRHLSYTCACKWYIYKIYDKQ